MRVENEKKRSKELEEEQTEINKKLNDNNCLEISFKDERRRGMCSKLSEQLKSAEDQLHKLDHVEDFGDVQLFMSDKKRQSLKDGVQWNESNAITKAKQAAMLFLQS